MSRQHAVARVDLAAVRENTAALRAGTRAEVMAVVKADAYGHGLVPCARAAVEGGATWLGTALLDEALALRTAGVVAEGGSAPRVLAWLLGPRDDFAAALMADIDVSVNAVWALDAVVAAAVGTGRVARVHLKVDTGLGRGGAAASDWFDLVAAACRAEAAGGVRVVGVWSHLAYADAPGHPTIAGQAEAFRLAIAAAEAAGLRPEVRHLANSAATLTAPEHHFDLVRPGLAVYGLSPVPEVGGPADFGLRPAMTLAADLVHLKRVPAGQGVSYGHTYTTSRETTLGLVPLGYADGVPRAGGNVGPVRVAGRTLTVAGRVCMDQVVLDLGDDDVQVGEEVVLFGDGRAGAPTAQDWAEATGTISYEIVTRIGPRVPRVYVGQSVVVSSAVAPKVLGDGAS